MKKGFVIDSLARSGSTTLANALSLHSDTQCLVEPFHPRRYGGQFHRMAMELGSAEPALNFIWNRWSGIKHVWNASLGWPFPMNRSINDSVILSASRVIVLERRNLLRRYVSAVVSHQLDFWIGTRAQFLKRLERIQLKEIDPRLVLKGIQDDKAAIKSRVSLIRRHNIPLLHLFYEDLFQEVQGTHHQFEIINRILRFLGVNQISEDIFNQKWAPLFDKAIYQWGSPDIYRKIPNIEILEQQLGSDETGWIFD